MGCEFLLPEAESLEPSPVKLSLFAVRELLPHNSYREFGGELRLTNAHPGTLVELLIPSGSLLREPSAVLDGYR